MNSTELISKELESLATEASTNFSFTGKLSSDITQSICNVVESIFIHGLRDPFFLKGSRYSKYPEPNFWPFISKFVKREVKKSIESMTQIKNEIGKARAWIRFSLNECSLEYYLKLFLNDKNQLALFYKPTAFICDQNKIQNFATFLKTISKFPFEAPTNSSLLNCWTPRPLILSGLTTLDIPTKQKIRTKYKNYDDTVEEMEVGVNALELLDNNSLIFDEFKTMLQTNDSDDVFSLCSHPSLIDGPSVNPPLKQMFSSNLACTPENSCLSIMEENRKSRFLVEKSPNEVIVRRKRYQKRPSSKSSNDDRSRETSRSHSRRQSQTDASIVNTSKIEPEKSTRTAETQSSDSGIGQCATSCIETNVIAPCSSYTLAFDVPHFNDASDNQQKIFDDDQHQSFIPTEAYGTSLQDELKMCLNDENPFDISDANQTCHSNEEFQHWLDHKDLDLAFSPSSGSSEPPPTFDIAFKNFLVKNKKESSDLSDTFKEELRSRNSNDFEIADNKEIKDDEFDILLAKTFELPYTPFEQVEYTESEEMVQIGENDDEGEPYKIPRKFLPLIRIPREKGLDQQQFRCPSCRRSIGGSFGKFRLCALSGLNFCDLCLKSGGESLIPGRMLLNWDCRPRSVSRASKSFLLSVSDEPFIRIDKLNAKLYDHCRQMRRIKELRLKLSLASVYLFSCKQTIAEDMRHRVWPKEYLYKEINLYSISDLEGVINGVLERHLNSLINFALSHIYSCTLCLLKGFICEICSSEKVLYPFQIDTTHRCSNCYTVFHKECFMKKNECSKCVRRSRYSLSSATGPIF